MKTLGYYNGTVDELEKMTVPMLDRACYFGDGIYDVAFSRNYKIYALEEHVDRFLHSAALLKIRPSFTKDSLCKLLKELIQQLDEGDLWVYFQLSRGTGFRTHSFLEDDRSNLWIMMRPAKIRDVYQPMRCISMEDTRFYHCNIKSLNLIPNVLATQATVEAGVDECILHRGDTVTECAHSNISILKNGVLLTHPADRYILAGTGRAHLIRACQKHGIPVKEIPYTLGELKEADEVIITSASALCMRVLELDGAPVGGRDTDRIRLLQDDLLHDFISKTE
ncbi:MAG: aminotransferase class IV [Clostridia bacterium]|nr:aminotransferase class IV [Clostridia bacterium]